MVSNGIFTLAQMQRFCMARRSHPQNAIDELPHFVQEKRTGKPEFEYDIYRMVPQPTFDEAVADVAESYSEDGEDTPSSVSDFGGIVGAQDTLDTTHNRLDKRFLRPPQDNRPIFGKEELLVVGGFESDD
jgi:hypothetical protein